MLNAAGLDTVVDIGTELERHKHNVVVFAAEFSKRNTFRSAARSLGHGICLLCLAYVLMAREGSVVAVRKLLDKANFRMFEGRDALAEKLLEIHALLER